ncbi:MULTISPECIES: hypothetical protein [Nocardiaceae]|uniref:hypothetical protein n=1 Tax=Nocardiaceae TaxID=85025 RepID=UPI001140196F|nr:MULTISPECIES: hypothetical protein [Rhodococcus]
MSLGARWVGGTDLVNELLVLTLDVFDTHASASVTLTTDGVVEQLPITGGPAATAQPLEEILADALSQCGAAAARRIGVLTPPEQVVITHPAHWTSQQSGALHAALDTAGFPPNRALVRPRPTAATG